MDIVPKRAPDSWLFCAVVALVATGVVMVYSASAIVAEDRYGDGAFFFKRQVAWAGLGMMALLIMQRTQYARLRRLTPWLLIMAILSLTLVLMPGIGRVAGGARRWIVLAGPFAFQPAEGAKLALALYLAHVLTKRGPGLGDPRAVSSPLLVTTLISGLILLQPDMGTSLLVALLAAAVFFLGGGGHHPDDRPASHHQHRGDHRRPAHYRRPAAVCQLRRIIAALCDDGNGDCAEHFTILREPPRRLRRLGAERGIAGTWEHGNALSRPHGQANRWDVGCLANFRVPPFPRSPIPVSW